MTPTINVKPGDVFVESIRGQIAVVLRLDSQKPKNPIIYLVGTNKRYKGPTSIVSSVIGTCDMDELNKALNGEGTAPKQKDDPHDPWMLEIERPELKDLKPNDMIKLCDGQTVKFLGFNSRRPKYPVLYERSPGKKFKTTSANIVCKVT